MTVRIDLHNKTISLSVRDLAFSDLSGASITQESSLPTRAALGRSIHSRHQNDQSSTGDDYHKEVTVRHETDICDFHVVIKGRIDGVVQRGDSVLVEEIKSVFNISSVPAALENGEYDAYRTQVQYYMWLLSGQLGRKVSGRIVFIGIADGGIHTEDVRLNKATLARHLRNRIAGIIEDEQLRHEWRAKQQEFAQRLKFPFPVKRRYQQEMMDDVESALLKGNDIMISAPTGVGKTIAALFPALRYALHKGLRVFFTTSKTTQQQIVMESLDLINGNGQSLHAIHLRAKEKMCANSIYFCHPDFCPYARDYYSRLKSSTAVDELLLHRIIRPEVVFETGRIHRLCPFELSLDTSLKCNIIVCDYNYVFDPSVFLRRFFLDKYDDSILIIDEAHNLYQRGMEYYSPSLDRNAIRELAAAHAGSSIFVLTEFSEILTSVDEYFGVLDAFGTDEYGTAAEYLVNLDVQFFRETQEQLDDIAVRYFLHRQISPAPAREDPVTGFLRDFSHFNYVLSLGGDEFSQIYNRRYASHRLKILCMDPSRQLGERVKGFYSTIAMSATLEPQTFYRDVLGFDRAVLLRRFPSPFPRENRKILIIPRVSTRYSVRQRFYEQTASIIAEIISIRTGNYLVFFPSFDFLDSVYSFMPARRIEITCQQRAMSDNERSLVLERLKQEDGLVVFAVQSGIFAEGVDYPGDMVIGVIIVGPGLPQYCFEQELMKIHYEDRYGMGFEYAYLYPGMNRVIQSAGRLIRSHDDKGIVALLGQRFATAHYNSLLPADWYLESPRELVSNRYSRDIADFWESVYNR
jgi:DNA excision repair protein ERCC-2